MSLFCLLTCNNILFLPSVVTGAFARGCDINDDDDGLNLCVNVLSLSSSAFNKV